MRRHHFKIVLVCLLFTCLAGCVTPTPTSTPEVTVSPTATPVPSQTPTITPPPGPTPTERVFLSPETCGDWNENGHILYLYSNDKNSGELTYASRFDLYIMNGNGCYPRLIMEDVSGSPAWSKDGQRIAIGCQNNTMLCILDAAEVLRACGPRHPTDGSCISDTAIQEIIALPQEVAGDNYLNHIVWSSDGVQILVEASNMIDPSIALIGGLGQSDDWTMIEEKDGTLMYEWDPVGPYMASSGIYLINTVSGERDRITTDGWSPVWSPDGSRIAFVKRSDDESKEWSGVAVVDVATKAVSWLYEPASFDFYHLMPQVLAIGTDLKKHRVLSWSLDGAYLAFQSPQYSSYDSHIYRLELSTGEIQILTAKHEGLSSRFGAPAWGP